MEQAVQQPQRSKTNCASNRNIWLSSRPWILGGKAVQIRAKACESNVQTNFRATFPSFESRSGDSIGLKNTVWRNMLEQECSRLFLITELWVPTSCVQKVWIGLDWPKIGLPKIGLDWPKIGLHARGLDRIQGVLLQSLYMWWLCCIYGFWCIDLLSGFVLNPKLTCIQGLVCSDSAQSLPHMLAYQVCMQSFYICLTQVCIWFALPVGSKGRVISTLLSNNSR